MVSARHRVLLNDDGLLRLKETKNSFTLISKDPFFKYDSINRFHNRAVPLHSDVHVLRIFTKSVKGVAVETSCNSVLVSRRIVDAEKRFCAWIVSA